MSRVASYHAREKRVQQVTNVRHYAHTVEISDEQHNCRVLPSVGGHLRPHTALDHPHEHATKGLRDEAGHDLNLARARLGKLSRLSAAVVHQVSM